MGQSTWGVAPARAPRSVFVMPPVIKSKEAKAAAAAASGKGKKKKWSKGKVKEKVNNLVLFDKNTFEKLLAEVPKYKMITPSILSDRLRTNGALARKAISVLMEKDLIRPVSVHSKQATYTRLPMSSKLSRSLDNACILRVKQQLGG